MTSVTFSGFLTLSTPCLYFGPIHGTKFTQPPLLHLLLGAPNPPSPCILHMYMPPWCMAWGVAALLEGATGSKTLPQRRKVGGSFLYSFIMLCGKYRSFWLSSAACLAIEGSSYVVHILCTFKVIILVPISCTGMFWQQHTCRFPALFCMHYP